MTTLRLLASLAGLLVLQANGGALPSDGVKEGVWWQSAPRDERLGYLAGYIDCAVYDAGKDMGRQSWYSLAPKISAQYAKRSDKLMQPVSAILKELVSAEAVRHGEEGGEHYDEKHGFFDGEYWRRGGGEHRLGFIEGYLDCWKTEGVKGGKFSMPAGKYVALLSDWFGISANDPRMVRADRATKKIAEALWIFRDR